MVSPSSSEGPPGPSVFELLRESVNGKNLATFAAILFFVSRNFTRIPSYSY